MRPDFCGWSALAPIAMLIEHVLGFRVDAVGRTITWRRDRGVSADRRVSADRSASGGRTGIRRLRCGAATVSLLDDGAGAVSVESDAALTVVIDGLPVAIEPGQRTLPL